RKRMKMMGDVVLDDLGGVNVLGLCGHGVSGRCRAKARFLEMETGIYGLKPIRAQCSMTSSWTVRVQRGRINPDAVK
ncbi:MAG: hypothetical protein ACREDX_07815, partial [Aestuariivirga sp.]